MWSRKRATVPTCLKSPGDSPKKTVVAPERLSIAGTAVLVDAVALEKREAPPLTAFHGDSEKLSARLSGKK